MRPVRYRLTSNIIDQEQYTLLVAAEIGRAPIVGLLLL